MTSENEAMATEFAVGGKISKVINGCKISKKAAFSSALLVVDALLVSLIIAYVPYTKIDWDAYMSQVTGFLQGERDYRNLKGDTGPLVYPAGFLYVYSAIQYVTGGEVYPAQILFGILYIVNLGILLFVYVNTDVLPWWAFSLLCLSKRVHSIFVLRLFNDCFAMTFLHAALALLLYQRWDLGLIIFSVAVSIKMNVLLYAPPLLVLMLKAMTIKGVISALTGAALVQVCTLQFNCFGMKDNTSGDAWMDLSILSTMQCHQFQQQNIRKTPNDIVTTMFVGNFIGIVCARSLHYQFYSWYFYSLPFLLWKTTFPTPLRIILFLGVELCWNIYPSNLYSSSALFCIHVAILWGLWTAPCEYPYLDGKSTQNKEE
ncbi:dol-P-Man:Man(5)GlcNAc(2)-PP-Dol alpha-1,3-mannosyltransferase [Macadamia integrifolia]|uniref:dol-P-Man:Man(5)GlcNAc(2)-PP-Dol alpha-1,3-mannosyltransferase n=1 Tax=Macadamia integrifolia TaxID=60698 RepID=UPI001C4E491D|nr:dol-P-Man:Man(5)GlcNAc(2)-PP-Dol alpha-1,3-mannosyltransferase [Macadamia integrifolia]